MIASNKPQKGKGCNQTNKEAPKANKHKPTKGNKTSETWKGCKKRDLSIQAWIQTKKYGKWQTKHKQANRN